MSSARSHLPYVVASFCIPALLIAAAAGIQRINGHAHTATGHCPRCGNAVAGAAIDTNQLRSSIVADAPGAPPPPEASVTTTASSETAD